MVSGFTEHLIMFAFGYGGDGFGAIFGESWDLKKKKRLAVFAYLENMFVKIDLHAF